MNEKNILFQIKSLEQLIIRDLFMKVMSNEVCIKKIPSPTQMRIIDYILECGDNPVYQKDLETIFNLRRATISEVLKTMEKNNMILRIVSKDDTRTKEIKLSKEAKELFDFHKKKLLELEDIITKDINVNDLEVFSKVISKMKENIKNMD